MSFTTPNLLKLFLIVFCFLTPLVSSWKLRTKRDQVAEAFQLGWKNYQAVALGHDDLLPLSRSYRDWLHLGATIVDSLDTIIIMGLQEEYQVARNWIAYNLSFEGDSKISVFETTIRIMGGLCSAHSLTGDRLFLDKAKQLAEKLLPAFLSPTGIPYMDICLKTGEADSSRLGGYSSLAAVGSVQMEFVYLAKQLNDSSFSNKVLKVISIINGTNFPDGLPPLFVDPETAKFQGRSYTIAGRADSFYEYLIKMWVLTNKNVPVFKSLFDKMMGTFYSRLLKFSTPNHLAYIASENDGELSYYFDELACFSGGMFTLASMKESANPILQQRYSSLGKNITNTCNEMRRRQTTSISPESVNFASGTDFVNSNPSYLLRPETIESYFYMYRATGDPIFQQWGWEAFQGISQYCKSPGGWNGISDVDSTSPSQDDYQQSFFLAETLKYLYLLFSDSDYISLDDYVFNTEAHPLKIFKEDFSQWKNIVQALLP